MNTFLVLFPIHCHNFSFHIKQSRDKDDVDTQIGVRILLGLHCTIFFTSGADRLITASLEPC